MATPLPTVVLVHGAWHTPPVYQDYIDALRARGFTVHCPRLPSCNGELPPNKSLPDDIACIRDVMLHLIDAGERVITAMHSYGGAVGTDAVEDLSLAKRKAMGRKGGVIHLAYLCAYILPPGGTVYNTVEQAGITHLWPVYVENYDDGSTFPKDAADMFFNGPDQEEMFEKSATVSGQTSDEQLRNGDEGYGLAGDSSDVRCDCPRPLGTKGIPGYHASKG